eukprot:240028_1
MSTDITNDNDKANVIINNFNVNYYQIIIISVVIIMVLIIVYQKTYLRKQQPINNNNQKLNQEIRIKREKKSNLCKVLPVIFGQEVKKLKVLNDKTILQLKTQLIDELNNDVDTFLNNYLNG